MFSSWKISNVVHEPLFMDIHELGSWTYSELWWTMNQFMNFFWINFVVHEHSWILHENTIDCLTNLSVHEKFNKFVHEYLMNIDEQRLNFSEQIIHEKSMKSVHENFMKCWWTIIRKQKNVEQIIYENLSMPINYLYVINEAVQ